MILYARNLSPFGRRVAVWLSLQDRPFEQRPLSPVDDFDALKQLSALGRAPVLELDDGARLIDSFAIMDFLESTATPAQKLLPPDPTARRDAMQLVAWGHGVAEKGVSLVYEKNRRPEEFHWRSWHERLEGQIRGALGVLEGFCPADGFFGGAAPTGPDVVATIAIDFLRATNPYLLDEVAPKLKALADRCDALPAFAPTNPNG